MDCVLRSAGEMGCQGEPGVLTLDWSTGFVEMDRKGPERLEGGLGWLVSALVITEYFWISQGLRFLFFKKKNESFLKLHLCGGWVVCATLCLEVRAQLFRVGFLFLSGSWGSNSSCPVWWQAPLPTEPS